jgi:hypothetical protein
MPPLSLYARARTYFSIAHETAGAACTRHSLHPLIFEGDPIKTRAHRAARLRRYVLNEAQRVYEDLLGRKITKFQRLLIALSSRSAIG